MNALAAELAAAIEHILGTSVLGRLVAPLRTARHRPSHGPSGSLRLPGGAEGDLERLGEWLAARGVGLVEVAGPQDFSWPGHWIAVTDTGRALVMFGSPSGALTTELRDGETIQSGFVLAQHDLDLERQMGRARGTVSSIVVAPRTAGPAHEVDRCRAIAGRGLDGDRYATAGGTFAAVGRLGQDLTLIDESALDAAALSAVEARRNIVTRGIDLDVLVGRRFTIGAVVCQGERRAEPCAHLQRLTKPGVLRALVHRGGIRADVISGGQIIVGDDVVPADAISV